MTLSADIQVGKARITGKLAPIFERIGIQMDTAAARLPKPVPVPNVWRYFAMRPEHFRNRMIAGFE